MFSHVSCCGARPLSPLAYLPSTVSASSKALLATLAENTIKSSSSKSSIANAQDLYIDGKVEFLSSINNDIQARCERLRVTCSPPSLRDDTVVFLASLQHAETGPESTWPNHRAAFARPFLFLHLQALSCATSSTSMILLLELVSHRTSELGPLGLRFWHPAPLRG